MKKIFLLILLGVIFTGCAAQGLVPSDEKLMRRVEAHQGLARNYEKSGELRKALLHLKIAARLSSDAPAGAAEVARVSNLIKQKAESHFKRAQKLLAQSKPDLARNELIKTLWYDPDHEQALMVLKARPELSNWSVYVVQKGDTLAGIALKTLGSADNVFLLKGLNNLTDRAGLLPGTRLIIPRLQEEMFAESALTPLPLATEEPEYVETEEEKVPEVSVSEELTGARGLFGKKDFTKALDVVLALRKIEPENQDVWLLENDIYCDYARQRAGENDFAGAEEIIGQADIKQPCVKETFSFLKKRRVDESQRLYLQGVNHYVNENLQAAINSWKNALAINPEHAKAQADMRKAQNLLERLNKLK